MKRHYGHFTLLELLVVIGIIALLAGILLPALERSRMAARRTACIGNLRQIGTALNLYAESYQYFLPNCRPLTADSTTSVPGLDIDMPALLTLPKLSDSLMPYLGNQKVFCCPGESDQRYFLEYGSSYEWNYLLNGRKLEEKTFRLAPLINMKDPVFVLDARSFHDESKAERGKNYLYENAQVSDQLKTEII